MNANGSDVQRLTEGLYRSAVPLVARRSEYSSLHPWVYGIDPDGSNMKAASSERGVMGRLLVALRQWIATTSWILAK
jgi:Tol biopolymer transport system component